MAAFRLKTHEKYVQLLWLLRTYTQYVEVVICYRDEPDNPLVLELKDLLIAREQVFQWQGTISYGDRPSILYRYRAAEHLFEYLETYENFFLESYKGGRYHLEYTEYGDNDIAFFDENGCPLVWATPHEGILYIREDLKEQLYYMNNTSGDRMHGLERSDKRHGMDG